MRGITTCEHLAAAARLSCVPLLVFVGTAYGAMESSWTEMGPAPITTGPFTGRCSAVVASPTNPGLYFVAAASGGVWRTSDAGSSWTPLTDDLLTNTFGALAMDPSNDAIVYAGTGEANFANHSYYGVGLYKSVDGGATWSLLGEGAFAGRTFSRIVVSHADSQVVYASTMPAGGFPPLNAAKGHPQMLDPVGVHASVDGGQTWTLLGGGLPATAASDLWMDPVDSSVLYAAIGDIFGSSDNGVYKSIDGGATWQKLAGGLPSSGVGRISLAVAPSNGQRIYAMITLPSTAIGGGASTEGVYRSDDGGATWVSVGPGNIQATYGWYLSTLIVDPTDPDTVFAGGLSLVRSTNAGDNWIAVTPPHVDMHGLAYGADHRLLCANDGGLHGSDTNGSSWAALNDGLGVIQFYAGLSTHPLDPTFVLGGFQDNGTNRREGVLTWSHRLGGDGGYTALHPDTPSTLFAEFQGSGNLYRSTDAGDTFSWRGSGINPGDRHSFLPPVTYGSSSTTTLWYATHRIYRSTDTGASWTAISADLTGGPPAAVRALVVAPSNPQTLYAATNDGRVLVSIDGGVAWAVSLTGMGGWPRVTRELSVDPLDDRVAYLAVAQFGTDQIRRTEDRGGSWTAIDGNLPDIPVNTVAVYHPADSGRMVFVGTDRGVFVSTGDEAVWSSYGSGLPHSAVIDLVVDAPSDRLLAGTMGRGLWSIPLPPPPANIPASSAWGVITLACLLVLAAAVLIVRRRRADNDPRQAALATRHVRA